MNRVRATLESEEHGQNQVKFTFSNPSQLSSEDIDTSKVNLNIIQSLPEEEDMVPTPLYILQRVVWVMFRIIFYFLKLFSVEMVKLFGCNKDKGIIRNCFCTFLTSAAVIFIAFFILTVSIFFLNNGEKSIYEFFTSSLSQTLTVSMYSAENIASVISSIKYYSRLGIFESMQTVLN